MSRLLNDAGASPSPPQETLLPSGLVRQGGLDRNTCSHIEGLDSSSNLHDVRDFLGHIHITTTSRYVRSPPVRGEPRASKVLGLLVPSHNECE